MIDLSEVGAPVTIDGASNYSLRFGIYLPGVRSSDGFKLLVRIIHQADRSNPLANTADVDLVWQPGTQLDLWTATTRLQKKILLVITARTAFISTGTNYGTNPPTTRQSPCGPRIHFHTEQTWAYWRE